MTRTQTFVQNIGLSNLITIGVLVVGLTGTFVGLSSKVDSLGKGLQDEVIQRKIEDERLRLEINQNWKANADEHAAIQVKLQDGFGKIESSLLDLDKTMSYHVGYHTGKGQ